jgi:hypothetical protein
MRLIYFIIFITLLQGCELPIMAVIPPDTPIVNPVDTSIVPEDTTSLPIVLDTCETYTEITDPAFVNTYVEITEIVTTDVIVIARTYTDTVPLDQGIGAVVDSLLSLAWPQYTHTSTVKESDPRIFTTIIDGTNDHNEFLLKTLIKYNGLKHYFGCASQAFMFAGAMTAEQFYQATRDYPSVNRVNHRGTAYDSLEYERIDTSIIRNCAAGREWAHFGWGIHADSIIQIYKVRGWNKVFSAAVPGNAERMVIDMSFMRADEGLILYYLKQGYQVITMD